jgi:hypothetical protein
MIENEFFTRYKPLTFSKIIGHDENIEKIEKWLKNYENVKVFLKKNNLLKKSLKGRKKKITIDISEEEEIYLSSYGNLLISGSNGCGKTSVINLILKKYKYDIINLNDIENNMKIIDEKTIFKLNSSKCIMLIDDYESIISSINKKAIIKIIKDNNYNRTMPIIIITNNAHNKQITDIKKYSNDIIMYAPNKIKIFKWINNICNDNEIKFDNGIVELFVNHCNGDMRKLLSQLYELKTIYKNKIITKKVFDEFEIIMKQKNPTLSLFDATEKLFVGKFDLNECMEIFEIDKVLIPLMIYQNYYKYINIENYYDIVKRLSFSDIFENYIYCEQNWDLLEIFSIISCVIPSYYSKKYNNGLTNQKLLFAIDLNRTSFKKKNKIQIIETNNEINKKSKSYVRNKTIDEFIYINDIKD